MSSWPLPLILVARQGILLEYYALFAWCLFTTKGRNCMDTNNSWNTQFISLHPPHAADLTPNDFRLFPKLKKPHLGHCYNSTEEIKAEMTKALKAIAVQDFSEYSKSWKKGWHKSVHRRNWFERIKKHSFLFFMQIHLIFWTHC